MGASPGLCCLPVWEGSWQQCTTGTGVLGRFLASGSPMSGQGGPGLLELSGGPHPRDRAAHHVMSCIKNPHASCPRAAPCPFSRAPGSLGWRNTSVECVGRTWAPGASAGTGDGLAPNHWVEQRWGGFLNRVSEFPRPDLLFFRCHIPDGWTDEMFGCACSMGAAGWRGTRKPCTSSLCLQQPSGESGRAGWVCGTQHTQTSWLGLPKPRPTPWQIPNSG